ncbi:MAG: ComF family protein [Ruminococcus sp.]|nr:ComF family protein [Ruminococcus sp.]
MDFTSKRRILHFFFPTRCPVCGEVIGAMDCFCTECSGRLTPFVGSFRISGADGTAAAFVYDRNISPAVILLKRGICGNAAYALGKALAERLRASGIADKADLIVPVPLHRLDRKKRGFNQSELIAAEVSRELGLPVNSRLIIKSRRTAEQKHLDRFRRRLNLDGAFTAAAPQNIAGRRIILIDDVSTTGTTLERVTALLKVCSAEAVYCAACCKTAPPSAKIGREND